VLYVNFDGATITRSDLDRWASNQWNPSWLPGGAANGVTVNAFFAGRSDREQIISGILSRLSADLAPFGITVQRHTGLAVENVGATTLFAGRSTLTHPHVACDVDFGNDNRTDIAFVGEENWGSAANISLALSDVFLHEAGHTYGLYHVQTVQSSVLYAESMGLRYSSDQSQWLQETSFMDRTFIEYRDENGNWHGPGGGQSQNSYRTMLSNHGQSAPAFTGNLATVDSSQPGVLAIAGSAAADQISLVELAGGVVEITINGQHYTVLGGLEQVVIDTLEEGRDLVQTAGKLTFELILDAGSSTLSHKLDAAAAGTWNGTALSQTGPGLGCCCPLCRAALDGALAGGVESYAPIEAWEAGGSEAKLEGPPANESDLVAIPPIARLGADVQRGDQDQLDPSANQTHGSDGDASGRRTVDEVVFDLEQLQELLAAAV
jgi:hypothetical protein